MGVVELNVRVKYWLASLRNCDFCPGDTATIRQIVTEELRSAGLTPIASCEAVDPRTGTVFEGGSVVEVIIPIQESHCAVHTFPPLKWVLLELSTCGKFEEAYAAFLTLIARFKPRAVEIHQHIFSPDTGL